MDVTLLMLIITGALLFLLVVLVLLYSIMAPRPAQPQHDYNDMSRIKNEVQHEVEEEAMEEVMPHKPPRLSAPGKKRL